MGTKKYKILRTKIWEQKLQEFGNKSYKNLGTNHDYRRNKNLGHKRNQDYMWNKNLFRGTNQG
jgi:hypothetical protein